MIKELYKVLYDLLKTFCKEYGISSDIYEQFGELKVQNLINFVNETKKYNLISHNYEDAYYYRTYLVSHDDCMEIICIDHYGEPYEWQTAQIMVKAFISQILDTELE